MAAPIICDMGNSGEDLARNITPAGRDFGIVPETDLERAIVTSPDWIEGASWGQPRPGHPEGEVAAHIREVLANVDVVALDAADRAQLRVIALVHDTFKDKVDQNQPRTGENHHGMIARRFAERYVTEVSVLDVIELHDEAFNSWGKGERSGKWDAAEERVGRLFERLGSNLPLYLRFYRADNETGGKDQTPLEWFEQVTQRRSGWGRPASDSL
jgi:hypothetical protein